MIGFLRGIVHAYGTDYVLLDVNNVGYRINFYHPAVLKLNGEILIYTFESVTEFERALYGFVSLEEYDLFTKLIGVKGIGPKVASGILANSSLDDLIDAIENENVAFIKSMPGIGAKTASQIILDLRGKLVAVDVNVNENEFNTVVEALKKLGYKDKEIRPVIKKLSKDKLSDDEFIRKALVLLSN